MCRRCLQFVPRRSIREKDSLWALAEKLRTAVSKQTLKIVQASSPIEDVRPDHALYDLYFFALRCTRCEREFQLIMDAYHGFGTWG